LFWAIYNSTLLFTFFPLIPPSASIPEYHCSFLSHLVFLRSVRRLLVTTSVVPISPILVTLMKEALSSSETSVPTRATRRKIPEDTIPYYIIEVRSETHTGVNIQIRGLTLGNSHRSEHSDPWFDFLIVRVRCAET
jgi:hypothetical protein